MSDLIERLKDKKNAKALGRHEQESREIFYKVGPENCLCYTPIGWSQAHNFYMDLEYIINPDYQPEPEYVDLEIEENEGFLGVWSPEFRITGIIGDYSLPYPFTHLHSLPSLPNFDCFWYEWKPGVGYTSNHVFWILGMVNYHRNRDRKVYARLRRDK